MATDQDMETCESGLQQETREPLIQYGEDGDRKSTNEHLWMVYLSTFVAVTGSFEFGSCVGFSSPVESDIRTDLKLSITEYSVFGSILTFGAMLGASTSGTIADFLGRKAAMRMSAIFCIVGWLAVYFAKGYLSLDIGRLCMGYGMGIYSYVVPIFIAEIAPKDLRGGLTTINQLMICTGVSFSFIVGAVLTWRTLALIGIIPCLAMVVGLFFIPESPRWLAKMGHRKEFEAALQKLRGKDADISQEEAEIQDYIDTLEKLPKTKMWDLFQKRYSRSVMVGVGLMVIQQFGGINAVCFYTSQIFLSAGFPTKVGTVSYACIQVVITIFGVFLMDKAGRRPLLLVSTAGLVLACLLVAASFFLQVHELAPAAVPGLAVSGILGYIGFFSVGMGAVPWVTMSEIFPINIKGVAGSMATLVNWIGAWTISFTFNFLMAWSSYGTFLLYAAVNALSILFIVKYLPETKGRTLEQIQADINK
ncbi:sugar transporter ERD6-like 7 [Macadamia integrifolia]|uniref:sugar transporter ERD6-like 7 n=1 Tax=Macadamia integrifolia TaxID=60698 RepID=UPI001C4EA5D5|nr:sugar transporter ERD6-like 7 [Macadamia integrifolia]